MNIILADVNPIGGRSAEREFTKSVVIIGRDAMECDIAFDNTQFPMVSRKHAELRWQNGEWYLVDLGSSYGTYLNGQRVQTPQQVPVGSKLQFGADGPAIVVIWFDAVDQQKQPSAAPAVPSPVQHPQANALPPTPPPPSAPSIPKAQLDFSSSPQRPPLRIEKPSIWLGREEGCDVVFDSSSTTVSRKHAEIAFVDGEFVLKDNKSFNGTLVNGQRIASPTPLYHSDEIQLGIGGPVMKFNSPERVAPMGSSLAGQRSVPVIEGAKSIADSSKTMVANLGVVKPPYSSKSTDEPQLLMTVPFGNKSELGIGRDETNDIKVDGLQISKHHAKIRRSGNEITIEDLNSTNGVFINGTRVSRHTMRPDDAIQVGAFVLRLDPAGNIGVFDTRAKMRVDVVNVIRDVKNRSGGGRIKVLDSISLSIQPNEFIGLLGPSGAGKSSLIEAMNGVRPARSGNVLINHLDLARHFDSLKQSIGYVPQDDIIHRELSVYRTLYYVRGFVSHVTFRREIDQIVNEVMDVTGLAERKNVQVSKLSGGQRKRVSIAVELITKPSVIFLDEPTSGLDPATEDRVMRLFKQIADSGRTVVMTTHAMENVKLFDKIAVLMRGRLVYFGPPDDALKFLGAESFKELYAKLEAPVNEGVKTHGEANRSNLEDHAAEDWRRKFAGMPEYKKFVEEPLKQVGTLPAASSKNKRRRLGIFGSVSQWITLSRRYLEVLLKDKLNLFILFAQAPIIAFLTFAVMGGELPRDFIYFVISIVAIWFGTSVSAREIVREEPVYKRERMFNLGILPYYFSKLFVLGLIVFIQCLLLYAPLKFFHFTGLMFMPGDLGGIPQFWTMLLTASVGIATGLLISALVRTSQMATSLVPLILIPQILFCGLVGVPHGVSKVISMTIPAAWSFDTMKRFSGLETLEPEGADPRDKTKGLGLYDHIESENEKALEKAKKDLENFKQVGGGSYQDGSGDPSMADDLMVPEMKRIPNDLSNYVTFMHPWMNEVLNQFVLMLMFWILAIITLIVQRLKDIK